MHDLLMFCAAAALLGRCIGVPVKVDGDGVVYTTRHRLCELVGR